MTEPLPTTDASLLPLLPQQAKLLAEKIGLPAVLRLIEARPGVPFYVPKNPDTSGWLREVLCDDALAALCEFYGGDILSLPKLDIVRSQLKARAIRAERANGASAREVALRYGLTRRRIIQITAGQDKMGDERQPDLFGEDKK
jgi:hypothetical protein